MMRYLSLCCALARTSLILGVLLPIGLAPLGALALENDSRSVFPGRRVGGGTRGDCALNSSALMAINPASHLAISSRNRPAVAFLVPEIEQSYPVEFSVQNAAGEAVYTKAFTINPTDQLVSVEVPDEALVDNQDYRWHFVGLCDAEDWTQNVVLTGWLRQVETESALVNPQLVATLTVAEQINLALTAQAEGYWGDAIATAVELYQHYPQDVLVQAHWQQLLQALALETGVE